MFLKGLLRRKAASPEKLDLDLFHEAQGVQVS